MNFNLVHYQQVNYNESGSGVTDRNRLIATSDGYMDNVHTLRNQYGADVVVLIYANSPGLCGVAGGIGVSSSNAFATTRDDCAIGNYSFVHEIAHLAGARHDNDSNSNPYTYGHGFRYNPGYWRTIMAVYDNVVNRIPYWSNPDKYYGGVAMGTASWRDNAQVWGVRAATMAGFKTIGPSVYINGPGHIPAGSNAQYTAVVSGGVSPFIYKWKKNGSNVGTGSTYYLSTNPGDSGPLTLFVTVTDNNNNSDTDNFSVFVDPYLKKRVVLPTEFALSENYPNPFNPSTIINFSLPEAADVSVKVYNIMGQEVATLINANMNRGFHNINFDARNLSSGVYIARMVALGKSGQTFSKELKMQLIK